MNINHHDMIVITCLLKLLIKIELLLSGFRNCGLSDTLGLIEITDQQPSTYVCCFQFLGLRAGAVKPNTSRQHWALILSPQHPPQIWFRLSKQRYVTVILQQALDETQWWYHGPYFQISMHIYTCPLTQLIPLNLEHGSKNYTTYSMG